MAAVNRFDTPARSNARPACADVRVVRRDLSLAARGAPLTPTRLFDSNDVFAVVRAFGDGVYVFTSAEDAAADAALSGGQVFCVGVNVGAASRATGNNTPLTRRELRELGH